jgi:hypothetical protein
MSPLNEPRRVGRPPIDLLTSRWAEWEPFMLMESRRTPDPASTFTRLKSTHRSRILALQQAHIAPATIRRHKLDNPLDSVELFEFQLRMVIERRRAQLHGRGGQGNFRKRKESA